MNTRRFTIWFLTALAVMGHVRSTLAQQTIPIVNAAPTCLDTSTKTVDMWIVSARMTRDNNFFKNTKAMGVKVNVTLSSPGQQVPSATFPKAQNVSLNDLPNNDPTLRVETNLRVFNRQDLDDVSTPAKPVTTTDVSLPTLFVRTQGDSAPIQVMNALINFSKTANLPANPYTGDFQMVGQLVNSLDTVFSNSPDTLDPNYALDFSTNQGSKCSGPKDLKDGIGVVISDYKGKPNPGIISTAQFTNYCFYSVGVDSNPTIQFIAKGQNACSAQAPNSGLQTLMNPQVIWMAAGTCKSNNCPSTAPSQSAMKAIRAKISNTSQLEKFLSDRVGASSSKQVLNAITKPGLVSIEHLTGREKSVLHLLDECNRVGISPEDCVSRPSSGKSR
jgi:hypothetical protein